MSEIPLKGLKVLEFTHTIMGPTAGLLFAELGADVIKIEPSPTAALSMNTNSLGGLTPPYFLNSL